MDNTLQNSNFYLVYNHIVQSDFDLRIVGLDLVPNKSAEYKPSIKISDMGGITLPKTYIDNETRVDQKSGYYFKKGVALFEFIAGKEIQVYLDTSNISVDFIRTLLNYPMACILSHRQLFSLHASAVLFEGKVLIFPGSTMAGKSTIAAFLLQKGAKLLTEDTAVIEIKQNKVFILPSYPFIKLSQEANKSLSFNNINGIALPHDKNQRRGHILKNDVFYNMPMPINYCIFLDFDNDDESIIELDYAQTIVKLIGSSLNIYPLTPQKHQTLFQWGAEFARYTKNLYFKRRKIFSSSNFLVHYIISKSLKG